jgi:prephenate dehydratase
LPRVAFQGERGAFSELAVRRQWPDGADAIACRSFPDALAQVLDGRADYAVIPVENAIIGPVLIASSALDEVRDQLVVHGDVRVPVHLCLMAQAGVALDEIHTVYSHPAALAQCRHFLAQHGWMDVCEHEDTAGAARFVAMTPDRTVAAIASEVAAVEYDLRILARFIEDMAANWTRFVVVSSR